MMAKEDFEPEYRKKKYHAVYKRNYKRKYRKL
jgi:hypothetical protein